MYQSLHSDKVAAEAALSGWMTMLNKAVHNTTGDIVMSSVEERLKSLDAAWTRFDKAHYRLLRECVDISESCWEEEQKSWQMNLEEYCSAREIAVEVLKDNGIDWKSFEKLNISDDQMRPRNEGHETPPPQYSSVVKNEMKKHHKTDDHHKTNHDKDKKSIEKRASKSTIGCFHRPKLPPEVQQQCAVRDDLVISGHKDFNSLYASNDTVQQSFTVNILGAPNNSTTTCGCDNINCPFCNMVMSIRNRDPNLD